MNARSAVLCASLPLVLAACASMEGEPYARPYALYQTESKRPTDLVRPAWVARIDGKPIIFGRTDPVEPGLRKVEVNLSGPPGGDKTSSETIEVDTKPCTRYYFSSKRSDVYSNDWKPFISGTEPIGECQGRFGAK
jgi:hypothetical protein